MQVDCYFCMLTYCPKFLDRYAWAISVDPDQTASKEQFDQGLHCLPFNQHTNLSNQFIQIVQ